MCSHFSRSAIKMGSHFAPREEVSKVVAKNGAGSWHTKPCGPGDLHRTGYCYYLETWLDSSRAEAQKSCEVRST